MICLIMSELFTNKYLSCQAAATAGSSDSRRLSSWKTSQFERKQNQNKLTTSAKSGSRAAAENSGPDSGLDMCQRRVLLPLRCGTIFSFPAKDRQELRSGSYPAVVLHSTAVTRILQRISAFFPIQGYLHRRNINIPWTS